jgi:hypothetical protein
MAIKARDLKPGMIIEHGFIKQSGNRFKILEVKKRNNNDEYLITDISLIDVPGYPKGYISPCGEEFIDKNGFKVISDKRKTIPWL